MRRLGEVAALLACAPLLLGFGLLEKRDSEVEAGNAALKAGKAEEALGHYDAAVKKLPADAGTHFDRGAALYALSRFDEAGQEFLRATEAKDPALKASAFYNLGNAFFKKEKYKDAVSAYTRSLGLRPEDKQAKWNLEIALRKQKDEEKKQQDQKDQDDKNKKKDDQKKDDKKKDDKKDQKDKNQKDKDQDKKDQKKDKDQKDKDQKDKDQSQKDKQDQQKQNQEQPKPQPSTPEEEKQIQSVLDNLERSSKDLEKERAKVRAVRRAPPERDW
ncbi:MAG TPA: tetratricopeptide repeat protein [Polyangia bacterium]|nr:tetratricopeptide repeat protein [Polyangia bacterium]